MNQTVRAALQAASEGLLYPSETDEPFEPLSWGRAVGDLTAREAARLAGASAAAVVEEQTLAEFFKPLTVDEADDAEQWRRLQQVVEEQLSGARVFRVGRVNIDVFIVGRAADGEWVGIKTRVVET
jgi:hypothetical protein